VHFERLVGLVLVYTSTTLVEEAVLGIILASVGYFLSERYKRSHGVTPWRVPSGMWAVLLLFLSLIGVLMYVIACLTTRPESGPADRDGGPQRRGPGARRGGGQRPGQWGAGAPQGWDAPGRGGWQAPPPGYGGAPPPGGWEAPPPPGTVFPGLGQPGPAGGAVAPAQAPPPPTPPRTPRSWLPDPSGRHELRYWDGTRFTEHVADGGKISTDPM
jgi:hypothetical protein